jgi:hypothetical protein
MTTSVQVFDKVFAFFHITRIEKSNIVMFGGRKDHEAYSRLSVQIFLVYSFTPVWWKVVEGTVVMPLTILTYPGSHEPK